MDQVQVLSLRGGLRSFEDVGPESRSIKIISMIENEEGVKDKDATIQECGDIMDVRVDKGTEFHP